MSDQTTKPALSSSQQAALDASQQKQLPSSDDLKLAALGQTSAAPVASDDDATRTSSPTTSSDELADSDKLAETLGSLQNIIERNADQLEKIKRDLKEKREMLRNIFDNDSQLSEAVEQVATYNTQVKDRKAKLQGDPQVTTLRVQIGEINEQKKEIEEALSNHLVNYYSLTNSKSFDTSDGDQWDFDIRATVKGRPNKSKDD